MIKIRTGKTRIVFLYKDLAIKIAKPRILRFFFRLLLLFFTSKKSRENYYKTYGKRFLTAARKYILLGFHTNISEYFYYKKYQDLDVMPVYNIYFYGWCIIQKRGIELGADYEFVCPYKKFGIYLSPETIGRHQYCLNEKRLVLVDYGHFETIRDLLRIKHLQ